MRLQIPADRKRRHQQKIDLVLRFLRTSIYSTTPILGSVMEVNDTWAIRKSLLQMEQRCLLRRAILLSPFGKLELWGITQAGQEACLLPGEHANAVTFNLGKVSIATLRHFLTLQQTRIKGERAGWKDFEYCDRAKRRLAAPASTTATQSDIRPDLLAVNPQGLKVAIECELSLKAPVRYKRDIIPGHIRQLNAGHYDFVLWLTESPNEQQTLHQSLRSAMTELQSENKIHVQRKFEGYRMFEFSNLQTWPNA